MSKPILVKENTQLLEQLECDIYLLLYKYAQQTGLLPIALQIDSREEPIGLRGSQLSSVKVTSIIEYSNY